MLLEQAVGHGVGQRRGIGRERTGLRTHVVQRDGEAPLAVAGFAQVGLRARRVGGAIDRGIHISGGSSHGVRQASALLARSIVAGRVARIHHGACRGHEQLRDHLRLSGGGQAGELRIGVDVLVHQRSDAGDLRRCHGRAAIVRVLVVVDGRIHVAARSRDFRLELQVGSHAPAGVARHGVVGLGFGLVATGLHALLDGDGLRSGITQGLALLVANLHHRNGLAGQPAIVGELALTSLVVAIIEHDDTDSTGVLALVDHLVIGVDVVLEQEPSVAANQGDLALELGPIAIDVAVIVIAVVIAATASDVAPDVIVVAIGQARPFHGRSIIVSRFHIAIRDFRTVSSLESRLSSRCGGLRDLAVCRGNRLEGFTVLGCHEDGRA